jgi:hypothetical protein
MENARSSDRRDRQIMAIIESQRRPGDGLAYPVPV